MPNDVEIADSTIWEILGAAVLAALAWAFKLERSRAKYLTRDEHGKICEANQSKLTELLGKIDKKLDKQDERSEKFCESITAKVDDLTVKVAILRANGRDLHL